jgi:Peptidase M15
MARFAIGLILLFSATAASAQTDFGIRSVSGQRTIVRVGVAEKAAQRDSDTVQARVGPEPALGSRAHSQQASWTPLVRGSGTLNAAASLGSSWGQVTSTYRTPSHNRAVGGVRNSFHLRGRAIDIARRPGVTHSMIAAAFRNAGYRLVESLDEGDHSHFAFAFNGDGTRMASNVPSKSELTKWGVVTVSSALLR